ncbi:MAG: hypothetical protein R2939_14415 [Kofleriaceae bacterium]
MIGARACGWAIVLAAGACQARVGELTVDAAPPTLDATVDAAPAPDAPLGPWSGASPLAPAAEEGLAEDDVTVADDELELIFAGRLPAGPKQLYAMTRASTADAWSAPPLIAELAAGGDSEAPRLGPDGNTLYFGSTRDGSAGQDVWTATRPDRASPWGTPTLVAEVNSVAADRWYGTCGAGTRYVMVSNRDGALDLFEGTPGAAPTSASTSCRRCRPI